jgi:hypothetical protein
MKRKVSPSFSEDSAAFSAMYFGSAEILGKAIG